SSGPGRDWPRRHSRTAREIAHQHLCRHSRVHLSGFELVADKFGAGSPNVVVGLPVVKFPARGELSMRVGDFMTSPAVFCRPEANLAAVAALMWDKDCGALPVVSEDGKVTGMITDRDICVALGTRNKRASEVTVRDVIYGQT